jgi:hypothetical protein
MAGLSAHPLRSDCLAWPATVRCSLLLLVYVRESFLIFLMMARKIAVASN